MSRPETPAEDFLRRPRLAPEGFTREQWETFDRDGFITLADAIAPGDLARYRSAAQECLEACEGYDPAHTWKVTGVVQRHTAFQELINHDRHIGYAYDLYGEQAMLGQADLFIRAPDSKVTPWHIDGPLVLPYRVFSPYLPLKLRIGYWLTDLEHADMGNLVYVPGSHRPDYGREHAGLEDAPGQTVFTARAGAMTLMHVNLWHRVQPNLSGRVRLNLFISYQPSWCARHYLYPRDWIRSLTREQQVLLRDYDDGKLLVRPPAADVPLFHDPGQRLGRGEREPWKVRRHTRYETHLSAAGAG